MNYSQITVNHSKVLANYCKLSINHHKSLSIICESFPNHENNFTVFLFCVYTPVRSGYELPLACTLNLNVSITSFKSQVDIIVSRYFSCLSSFCQLILNIMNIYNVYINDYVPFITM